MDGIPLEGDSAFSAQGAGRCENLGGVVGDLHIAPGAGDPTLGVDQEGGALYAHIFAAVELLLDPDAPGSQAAPSSSEARTTARSYLALNLSCFFTVSLDTPMTGQPKAAKSADRAVKSWASRVQPVVSSLG